MDLTFNIFSLFDILALLQGVILGALLLFISKTKSTFFLGILLILYSLELVNHILYDLGTYDYYPELYGLPFNFYWIIYPLFYIYTQKVSIFTKHKIKYWLLYPGILSYAIQLIIFLQPYEIKIDIFNNTWFTVFMVSGAFYSWIVALWNFKLLKKHSIEVRDSFSRVEDKELKWARTFLIFSIIGSSISIFSFYQFDNHFYAKILYTLFNLLVIYWISYHGIIQRNILMLLSNMKDRTLAQNDYLEESENVTSENGSINELMQEIDAFMKSSESFTQSELTIVDVAQNLRIHTKQISRAINKVRNQNFNSYVNQFRIEKAITLLRESNMSLSIEGMGYEVGFHSKSAFYAAFKKTTGTTPTKFKERNAA